MPLPEGVRIRPARRGDRDSIYRLFAELGVTVPSHDQSNTLSWIVSHPEIEVLIAVDPADRGVGMLALTHRPCLRVGGRLATIDSFVVAAEMRRRGIGAELLARTMERVRMLGCKQVELAVNEPGSHDFLRKRGFAGTGGVLALWSCASS